VPVAVAVEVEGFGLVQELLRFRDGFFEGAGLGKGTASAMI